MTFYISTAIWVHSLLIRASQAGSFSTVARKGDEERGDVLVCVTDGTGKCSVFGRVYSPEGAIVFARMPQGAPVSDSTSAQAYIERRVEQDPDIWVLDIEDKQLRHFIAERILPDEDPFS